MRYNSNFQLDYLTHLYISFHVSFFTARAGNVSVILITSRSRCKPFFLLYHRITYVCYNLTLADSARGHTVAAHCAFWRVSLISSWGFRDSDLRLVFKSVCDSRCHPLFHILRMTFQNFYFFTRLNFSFLSYKSRKRK